MSFKNYQQTSDTDSASEDEKDVQRCAYLPKGHEVISKTKTYTVSGVEHTVTADETVNQAILEAANNSIRKAFSRKIKWDPEDITPELMKQHPFKNYAESYVRTRALNTWKDLNKKLREKQEKQFKGLLDVSRKTRNPQLDSWLEELETLQVMLGELQVIIQSQKNEENSKRPTIKSTEKKSSVGKTSLLKPTFGRTESVSLLKPIDRGVKRIQPQPTTSKIHDNDVRGEPQKHRRREPEEDMWPKEGIRGPKFRREVEDESYEDSIREKKDGIEKARFLRQKATYGDSNTGSDTESSAVDKQRGAASEFRDTDQDSTHELFGVSFRRLQSSLDKTNELTERELLLREKAIGIREAKRGAGTDENVGGRHRGMEDNGGASVSGNDGNMGARGLMGAPRHGTADNRGASISGTDETVGAPHRRTVTNEERIENLELQMALLMSKVEELIELQSDRGTGSN